MRFGATMYAPAGEEIQPDHLAAAGRGLEERGFESIWLADHLILLGGHRSPYPYSADGRAPIDGDTAFVEPLTGLAYLAGTTTTLRLGTGICLIAERNPLYTAKQVADIDSLSGGRVELGVGVGWLRDEFEALGVPFEDRGARADEHLQVMKDLWTGEPASHRGVRYVIEGCRMRPRPAQRPHPRIHVGGHSKAALRRVAAHGNGWYGQGLGPSEVKALLGDLDQHLAERGRTRTDIEVSISVAGRITPTLLDQYRGVGVDRLILPVALRQPDDLMAALDRLAARTTQMEAELVRSTT